MADKKAASSESGSDVEVIAGPAPSQYISPLRRRNEDEKSSRSQAVVATQPASTQPASSFRPAVIARFRPKKRPRTDSSDVDEACDADISDVSDEGDSASPVNTGLFTILRRSDLSPGDMDWIVARRLYSCSDFSQPGSGGLTEDELLDLIVQCNNCKRFVTRNYFRSWHGSKCKQ